MDRETAALEEQVAEAQAAFDQAQDDLAASQRALHDAQADLDAALRARDGEKDPHEDQKARMAYIRSQHEQRAERHGIAMQLREGSPDPDVLDPRSTLDKAMQRKTKRGTARPKVAA